MSETPAYNSVASETRSQFLLKQPSSRSVRGWAFIRNDFWPPPEYSTEGKVSPATFNGQLSACAGNCGQYHPKFCLERWYSRTEQNILKYSINSTLKPFSSWEELRANQAPNVQLLETVRWVNVARAFGLSWENPPQHARPPAWPRPKHSRGKCSQYFQYPENMSHKAPKTHYPKVAQHWLGPRHRLEERKTPSDRTFLSSFVICTELRTVVYCWHSPVLTLGSPEQSQNTLPLQTRQRQRNHSCRATGRSLTTNLTGWKCKTNSTPRR